jgi:diacylglycerol kinase (ATP)
MASGSLQSLFNPIAGGGRARRAANRLDALLRDAGYETRLGTTRVEGGQERAAGGGSGASYRAVIVVGGDGAVRAASDDAIRGRAPLYHVPLGTENLFAREFGMTRHPQRLLDALQQARVRWVDAGLANGRRFVLMASVGIDAEVVHDLAGVRGTSISHLTYVRPILRQFRRWRPPRLDITVDGHNLDLEPPGMVIVANCRQYMRGLNPAADADLSDGRLDVVHFPVRGVVDLILWMGRCARRRQLAHPRITHRLASSVHVDCADPQRVQLDGDPVPDRAGGASGPLRLEIEPGVLPVLLPPGDDR